MAQDENEFDDREPAQSRGVKTRIPVNPSERAFCEKAISKGWDFTKRGWPDFLVTKADGQVIMVEVKPRCKTVDRFIRLKYDQAATFDFFSSMGIKCYVSDGKTMELYDRTKHYGKRIRA